jgi:hypothetical protein
MHVTISAACCLASLQTCHHGAPTWVEQAPGSWPRCTPGSRQSLNGFSVYPAMDVSQVRTRADARQRQQGYRAELNPNVWANKTAFKVAVTDANSCATVGHSA